MPFESATSNQQNHRSTSPSPPSPPSPSSSSSSPSPSALESNAVAMAVGRHLSLRGKRLDQVQFSSTSTHSTSGTSVEETARIVAQQVSKRFHCPSIAVLDSLHAFVTNELAPATISGRLNSDQSMVTGITMTSWSHSENNLAWNRLSALMALNTLSLRLNSTTDREQAPTSTSTSTSTSRLVDSYLSFSQLSHKSMTLTAQATTRSQAVNMHTLLPGRSHLYYYRHHFQDCYRYYIYHICYHHHCYHTSTVIIPPLLSYPDYHFYCQTYYHITTATTTTSTTGDIIAPTCNYGLVGMADASNPTGNGAQPDYILGQCGNFIRCLDKALDLID